MEIRRGSATLHWRDAGEKASFIGKMCLVDPDGGNLAVLDFGCYVQQLPSGTVILWYHDGNEAGDSKLKNPQIHFIAFDPTLLTPIDDLPKACDSMSPRHLGVYLPSGAVAETWVSAALPTRVAREPTTGRIQGEGIRN